MKPTFAILIGTHGDRLWERLATERAIPSALVQGADEVLSRHETMGKIHEVRNALAADAKSDWLVFLDADDHLAPGFIDALRGAAPPAGERALLNPAVSHWDWRDDPAKAGCFPPKDLRDGNYMIIGTAVPRELFLEVGGFHDWPLGFEDWELWIRCEKAGARVIQVPEAVYYIDSTEHSQTLALNAAQRAERFGSIRRLHWPERYA